MRANRRRQRTTDPLVTPDAVRAVLDQLRERLPEIIPAREKLAIKMLDAVRHIERRPATDTNRGRPSRWNRKDLLQVAGQLKSILHRETKGRVSLNSFIGLYLRTLNFPKDVTKALVEGDINLFEASQLARLTEERLNISAPEARECRREILRAHVLAQGSQGSLQSRINEQLGARKTQAMAANSLRSVGTELVDELLELDPYDTRHLFWEELRRIASALREVTPDDVDDKTLNELLSVSDRLSGVLARIQKQRRKRKKH
ncbi:MAG: hypothetical protein QOJ02_4272 [Acidobacteriota bacterium]|nr:hypothetical protein [Acidobacteriota bacterium]